MSPTHAREPVPHACRLGKVEDLAYVVETWVKTDKSWLGKRRAKEATHDVRVRLTGEAITLRVAHDLADDDAIFAWAVLEGDTVLWAYTREPLRRMGLQTSLLGDLVVQVKENQ
jgi:hypothetical protein